MNKLKLQSQTKLYFCKAKADIKYAPVFLIIVDQCVINSFLSTIKRWFWGLKANIFKSLSHFYAMALCMVAVSKDGRLSGWCRNEYITKSSSQFGWILTLVLLLVLLLLPSAAGEAVDKRGKGKPTVKLKCSKELKDKQSWMIVNDSTLSHINVKLCHIISAGLNN